MNMKKLIIVLSCLGLVYACGENSGPFIDIKTITKGAYPRLIEGGNAEFDLNNVNGSKMDYEVEFVDEQRGRLIKEYRVFLSFKDNSPENGDSKKAEKLWKSFGQSDFKDSEAGYRSIGLSTSLQELNQELGLVTSDQTAGDLFAFRSEVELSDGAVYGSANSSATVVGAAFISFFDFQATLTCLYDTKLFTGAYQMSYVEAPTGAFGATFGDEPPLVTLEPLEGSKTRRKFKAVYLPQLGLGNDPMDFIIDLVCDKIVVNDNMAAGLACASGITIGSTKEKVSTFNVADDSTLIIHFTEFQKDGGCEAPPAVISIQLKKI